MARARLMTRPFLNRSLDRATTVDTGRGCYGGNTGKSRLPWRRRRHSRRERKKLSAKCDFSHILARRPGLHLRAGNNTSVTKSAAIRSIGKI